MEQALCNLIGVSKFQMAEVDGLNPPPPSTLPDPIFLNKWQSEWKIGTAYKANVEMEYPRVHVMHCAHPSYCAYVGPYSVASCVSPATVFHPMAVVMCDFTFNSILRHSYSFSHFVREVQPSYVILYDPDVTCVRQLEMHRARSPGVPLRVYFLFYDSSVEEQVCGCGEGVWGECVGEWVGRVWVRVCVGVSR